MGTMNGMQRQSLSEEAVARLVDPRTGQRLRPLGVVRGRTVWPMMGASPDDPSDTDSGDDEGADDDGDNPEGGKSKSKDSEGGGDPEDTKDSGNPDAKIEDLEQEKERHFRRRKEAEKRAEQAERELNELKAKDTPEVERLTQQVSTLETQNTALEENLTTARMEIAFLKDNSYSWHNPGRALKLADLSGVEIDDDGNVHGLRAALDKLAKSDPYLISQESKEKDKKEKKDLPNTDDPKNPGKKQETKDSKDKKKSELLQKYPALRR